MKNKPAIFISVLAGLSASVFGQLNTFSPYSRYGLGELAPTTLAHNAGMGGAFIALKPDSTTPIFINAGNPAAYPLIRLTTLEVGGRFIYSHFTGAGNSSLNKWTANFAYGTLGFPVRRNGGAAFGIMPYSDVGYETQNKTDVEGIGSMTYRFNGSGGLNKAFLGYGVMPFNRRLGKFRAKRLNVPDSARTLSRGQYKFLEAGSKLLSDLSIGANVNYIFGSTQNITRVVFPNSLLYNNTYRERSITMGDFTGNFGLQTGLSVDSVHDPKKRIQKIEQQITAFTAQGVFSEQELKIKRDSLERATPSYKRAFREKVKFTFGYFANLQNPLKVSYNTAAYNYVLGATGEEVVRDTVVFQVDQRSTITLPLEQGFGIGLKKGERLNVVADFAITDWTTFKYLGSASDLIKNYRTAIGVSFVPEKSAAGRGAFFKTINYRLGASYQTGYIKIQNAVVSDYFVSAGIGLPVGTNRKTSMVNVSLQYGQMGSSNPNLIRQNYFRVNFGFTFCDTWFQKYRYD